MEASVVHLSNKAAVGVGITFPVEHLNKHLNQGSLGVTDCNVICDICETFNATFPVEQQLNTAFNIGSERGKWIGNITNNANAIKQHLMDTLGNNPRNLRELPRVDRMHGYDNGEPNGYDKLDLCKNSYDHIQACRDMIDKHKHLLPPS